MRRLCMNCRFEVGSLLICDATVWSKEKYLNVYNGKERRYFSKYVEPCEVNKNLDCKYYQRKWWKFWVKDD